MLKKAINHYDELYQRMSDTQTVQLIDDTAHHYQIIQTGWDQHSRRIYTSLHLSIQNGKIYIHSDPTEEGIANVLTEKGIPKSDIVLEYQAPTLRQYTPYAKA
ncbi:MAG: XisI protein [Phormidium tanganyikae FI6-MK23]|nr:XisI protein [Phormidium tanganyikae FI6-MK23]